MFCPNCGNQLEDGSRFCPACGNPVTSEGTQQGAQNTSGSTQNQYTQHIHMQYVYKDYLAHLVLPWTQPRVTFKPHSTGTNAIWLPFSAAISNIT